MSFDQVDKLLPCFLLTEDTGEIGCGGDGMFFSTPRICMHMCCASITTITPMGLSVFVCTPLFVW